MFHELLVIVNLFLLMMIEVCNSLYDWDYSFDVHLVLCAAHSSLDQYLADWLGLDQSRYQWALNDYYENNRTVSNFSFTFLIILILVRTWNSL